MTEGGNNVSLFSSEINIRLDVVMVTETRSHDNCNCSSSGRGSVDRAHTIVPRTFPVGDEITAPLFFSPLMLKMLLP